MMWHAWHDVTPGEGLPARFTAVVDELEARGVHVPVRLLAATPFVLRFPHTYLSAVDPGRMLYGITFPGETPPVPLRPAFRALTTRVIALKELSPRERFAELAPFPVTAPMRLGVVPMGSADGLRWLHAGHVSETAGCYEMETACGAVAATGCKLRKSAPLARSCEETCRAFI